MNVKVEVDFDKVILQDNEEDGMLTGEVKFILYKGNHYHLTLENFHKFFEHPEAVNTFVYSIGKLFGEIQNSF